MRKLVKKLNNYTKLYDEGRPAISDKEWDDMYFKLQKMEEETGVVLPDSPTHSIQYEVVNQLNKVEHNHPMLSLKKTKEVAEVYSFAKGHSVIAMPKMDGLTCSLTYENGELVRAETRGNGIIGEDVLHNARYVKGIPLMINRTERVVVDGEVVCKWGDFDEFKDLYKNPRNFASGSIRLLDSGECARRHLSFVAWDVIEGFNEYSKLSEKLFELRDYNFETVHYNTTGDNTSIEVLEMIIECVTEYAAGHGHPIDGVVFKYDDCDFYQSLGATDHHFRGGLAYKFYDETYPTELLNIEWTMGRTGVLTPVAVFNPIDMDGSVVERASMHNISVMRELLGDTPFKGQKINVFKANMIIPQISDAEISNLVDWTIDKGYILNKPTVCPVCGGDVRVIESDGGVLNLYCINSNCEGKLINRLEHFCGKKGVDIKGLSTSTLEKLIEWGWVQDFEDIYTLNKHRMEWMKKPGFGPKSVDKILDAISESQTTTTFESFLVALGIPLIGVAQAKEICKKFPSWVKFEEAIDSRYNFSKINGFGESKTKALLNFDYTTAKKLITYNPNAYLTPVEDEKVEVNQTCSGMNFVITGSLKKFKNRAALVQEIEKLGGKVVGAVSKNTTYLINNDKESQSTKNVAAQKLNIPILSEEDFTEKFLER